MKHLNENNNNNVLFNNTDVNETNPDITSLISNSIPNDLTDDTGEIKFNDSEVFKMYSPPLFDVEDIDVNGEVIKVDDKQTFEHTVTESANDFANTIIINPDLKQFIIENAGGSVGIKVNGKYRFTGNDFIIACLIKAAMKGNIQAIDRLIELTGTKVENNKIHNKEDNNADDIDKKLEIEIVNTK